MAIDDGNAEVVDILVSARGTRDQIAVGLRRVAEGLSASLWAHVEWDHPEYGAGEFDLMPIGAGTPRISNRAILAAEESGILAAYDPEPAAGESAMRMEGDGVSGL